MMFNIKFSHNYQKLDRAFTRGDMTARLLLAIKVDYKDLSDVFVAYDAGYIENKFYAQYPLPKTKLILLIFQSYAFKKIFTTVRRYTPPKWRYYKGSEGLFFEVIMEDMGEVANNGRVNK